MAFFSKIKKLWGAEDKAAAQATSAEREEARAEAKDASSEAETEPAGQEAVAPGVAAPGEVVPTLLENAAAPVRPVEPVEPENAPAAPVESESVPEHGWRDDLLAALREPEPHIARWLDIILKDTPAAGPELWDRLAFLFAALDVAENEAEAFIADIQDWLGKTGVSAVAEFRSDLQYRLALALDMEEAPEEKKRFWHKLFQGLARTRNSITGGFYELFNGPGELDDDFWDELEELLITSDVGMEAAGVLLGRLKNEARKSGAVSRLDIEALFIAEISAIFKSHRRLKTAERPEVVLMVGVNGAGKTTTIAKLAYRAKLQGRKVLLAAADTFRAAAVEQLETWAGRVGVGFHAKAPGDDPAAVAFEAIDRAAQEGADLVFVDTAGRLQTKTNLMEELAKINRTLNKKVPGAPHRCVLVLDATTGQNALSQVKLFNEASGVDEIILSKLDGTAKGGVAVGIALQFGIPISFIGLGEKMEDLRPFDPQTFAKALLGLDAPGA